MFEGFFEEYVEESTEESVAKSVEYLSQSPNHPQSLFAAEWCLGREGPNSENDTPCRLASFVWMRLEQQLPVSLKEFLG